MREPVDKASREVDRKLAKADAELSKLEAEAKDGTVTPELDQAMEDAETQVQVAKSLKREVEKRLDQPDDTKQKTNSQ